MSSLIIRGIVPQKSRESPVRGSGSTSAIDLSKKPCLVLEDDLPLNFLANSSATSATAPENPQASSSSSSSAATPPRSTKSRVDLITCVKCKKTLKDPKILGCLHSCCSQCLPSLNHNCPDCHKKVEVFQKTWPLTIRLLDPNLPTKLTLPEVCSEHQCWLMLAENGHSSCPECFPDVSHKSLRGSGEKTRKALKRLTDKVGSIRQANKDTTMDLVNKKFDEYIRQLENQRKETLARLKEKALSTNNLQDTALFLVEECNNVEVVSGGNFVIQVMEGWVQDHEGKVTAITLKGKGEEDVFKAIKNLSFNFH